MHLDVIFPFTSACRIVVAPEENPLPGALNGPRPLQNKCSRVEMAPPDNIDPSAEEIWRA